MFGNDHAQEEARAVAALVEAQQQLFRDFTNAVVAERDWMRGSGTIGNETALETAKRVAGATPFTLANIEAMILVKVASGVAEAELVEQIAMETWFRRHDKKLFERAESRVARVFTDWGHPEPSRELVGKVVERMVDIQRIAIESNFDAKLAKKRGWQQGRENY